MAQFGQTCPLKGSVFDGRGANYPISAYWVFQGNKIHHTRDLKILADLRWANRVEVWGCQQLDGSPRLWQQDMSCDGQIYSQLMEFEWDPNTCRVKPGSATFFKSKDWQVPEKDESSFLNRIQTRIAGRVRQQVQRRGGCSITPKLRKEGAIQHIVKTPKGRYAVEQHEDLYLNLERAPEVHAFRCNNGHWRMRPGKRAECIYGKQERKARFRWLEEDGEISNEGVKQDPDLPENYWEQAEERMRDLTCPPKRTPPPGKEGAVYNPYTKSWHFAGRKR